MLDHIANQIIIMAGTPIIKIGPNTYRAVFGYPNLVTTDPPWGNAVSKTGMAIYRSKLHATEKRNFQLLPAAWQRRDAAM